MPVRVGQEIQEVLRRGDGDLNLFRTAKILFRRDELRHPSLVCSVFPAGRFTQAGNLAKGIRRLGAFTQELAKKSASSYPESSG